MLRSAVLILAVSSQVGCSIFEDEAGRGYVERAALAPATFTTADVRAIINRPHPVLQTPVVCTEPTPDVAKALSAAVQFNASGGNAGTTGNLAGGAASAEALTALAGRSTALLGLRDGLYRACEAYANGAIGADAYGLILSRYGQLMTTLFLGQDIASAPGTEAGTAIQSPPVTINVSGNPVVGAGQPQPPPPPPGPGAPQAASGANTTASGALALARMNEDYLNLGYSLDSLVIACVNNGDLTRRLAGWPGNRWLDQICPQLGNLEAFSKLAKAAVTLQKGGILASPVNPTGAPSSPPKAQR